MKSTDKSTPLIIKPPVHDLTPHQYWQRDVESLKRTLYRLKSLPPAMGIKWRDGMVGYYSGRLAELVLVEPKEES